MKYFAIKNFQCHAVEENVEPWKFVQKVPLKGNKIDHQAWLSDPATEHLLFSSFEGEAAGVRVDSKDNPPVKQYALVVDYDSLSDDVPDDTILKRCCSGMQPTWRSTTFSGNTRLVWEFEKPVLVHNHTFAKAFQKVLKDRLKLTKVLPGLDVKAMETAGQYYDCGTDWKQLSKDKVPEQLLISWIDIAGKRTDWSKLGGVDVPIDRVFKQVEEKFPGRWQGPFEEGARGCRFWDGTASNQSAAIVRSSGMQCFTGEAAFVPWAAIFGTAFVEEYQDERIGESVVGVHFDGDKYWRKEGGIWTAFNQQDTRLMLKVTQGLDPSTGKGEVASEVDRAVHSIQTQHKIDGAVPMVHRPQGLIEDRDGLIYLNTSRVECIQPLGSGVWGDGFDWTSRFVRAILGDDQFWPFMAYWQVAYVGCLEKRPVAGQNAFLAGESATGKTLLMHLLFAASMGGAVDASDYLTGMDSFNGYLFDRAVWTVDDVTPLADFKKKAMWEANLKKMAANRRFTVNAKFKGQQTVEWLGRVVVTANADPESIRVLPSLEASTADKICLFKSGAGTLPLFDEVSDLEATVRQELPALLAWLAGVQIDKQYMQGGRYKASAYHHPDLVETARESSQAGSFEELLIIWMMALGEDFEGSATDVLVSMRTVEGLQEILRGVSRDAIGRRLAGAAASGSLPIRYRMLRGKRVWRIYFDDVQRISGLNP